MLQTTKSNTTNKEENKLTMTCPVHIHIDRNETYVHVWAITANTGSMCHFYDLLKEQTKLLFIVFCT